MINMQNIWFVSYILALTERTPAETNYSLLFVLSLPFSSSAVSFVLLFIAQTQYLA